MERVILVDENDCPIGTEEKLRAHQDGGRLHRAFSVFIYDRDGRMLLQKRAAGKYHFAGLWSNACCSHPRPEETTIDAARRRVREELGIDTELRDTRSFTYHAFDHASGLHEREFVHVLTGNYDGEIRPDLDEVSEIRWVDDRQLKKETSITPDRFTPWFLAALRLMTEA
ncbi:MAG: isopentenyl-diphosphate Delta-isomerase [Planctomycetes bacterium]|nr:isopentenyl-diphosphate Delta-isomerase [Planctomycetota bacterium]